MPLSDLSFVVGPELGMPSVTQPVILLGGGSAEVIPRNVAIELSETGQNWLITWDAVATANRYQIVRGTSPDSVGALVVGETEGFQYIDEDAAPGATYYYSIRAITDIGTSIRSQQVRTFATVANVQATDGVHFDRVVVTWDLVPDIRQYEVWRRQGEGGGLVLITTTSATNFHDVDVVPNAPLLLRGPWARRLTVGALVSRIGRVGGAGSVLT